MSVFFGFDGTVAVWMSVDECGMMARVVNTKLGPAHHGSFAQPLLTV
jgi:hypothetical protein